MAYETHLWRAQEEPTIELFNHIEGGIVNAETDIIQQFEAVDANTVSKASGLVGLDGSPALDGKLSIQTSGKGLVFDNGAQMYAAGSNAQLIGSFYSSKDGTIAAPAYRSCIRGYKTGAQTLSSGTNYITLSGAEGIASSGGSAFLRNGGLAIDHPDGSGYYLMHCAVRVNALRDAASGLGYTLKIYSSTNGASQSLVRARHGAYASQASAITLYFTWGETLSSGGYIMPMIDVSNYDSSDSVTVQAASISAIRLK